MKTDPTPPALLAVGTFVVDYHKVLDHYPEERSYARVIRERVSNGGAPLNLLIDLAKLGVDFELHAAGKVGRDLDGQLVLEACRKHGIHTEQLQAVEGASTGYTDVFTVESTGRHTCFHSCGIGDSFARRDVKLRAIKPRMLFLGSLGALGRMDRHNPEFGRKGATQLVRDAHKQGIISVIELAPIDQQTGIKDYAETLAHADYLILSDRLAESMLGMSLYAEGQFDVDLARMAAKRFLDCGLRRAVVIQSGAGAIQLDADGGLHEQSGILLPSSQRVGSAGSDHAFCAGYIEGLFKAKSVEHCLMQGIAVARACRSHLTPSEGIPSLEECMERVRQAVST
ncbi:MAG: carbohydrate kinase family protein [Akkermansiaceae bacterium]|nr:carbohydrate kinase family protein [Akkermansiaceae bacterium]